MTGSGKGTEGGTETGIGKEIGTGAAPMTRACAQSATGHPQATGATAGSPTGDRTGDYAFLYTS